MPQLSKKELRAELIRRRRAMDKSTKQQSDELIYNKLWELVSEKDPSAVLCYVSVNDESDTRRFIETALSAGKSVFVPRCSGREMEFFRIDRLSELIEGAFGIPEPTSSEKASALYGTMCIVPALSFDREGYRLGYGGGYYDRFLKDYEGISVGLCYRELMGDVPRETFDIPVNIVITEDETLYGGKE